MVALAITVVPLSVYAAQCGGANQRVTTSINIGCTGTGNPLTDMLFGVIRFLSLGVGLVIIASLIWAGIQYTLSRGDPGATAKAVDRIVNTVVALLVYIFGFALLNFVIPGGFFT